MVNSVSGATSVALKHRFPRRDGAQPIPRGTDRHRAALKGGPRSSRSRAPSWNGRASNSCPIALFGLATGGQATRP